MALNAAMAVAVFVSWGAMAFSVKNGVLSASGMKSLRYFTVLSNLLQGFASLAHITAVARVLAGRTACVARAVVRLKYAAVVSVSITFLTVMLFLGPVLGYRGMFAGPNLWFHLVVPLAAALDFCALDREGRVFFVDSIIALLPVALYGVFYGLNILINGMGEPGRSNDWYGFALGGAKTIPLAFLIIGLASWGVALLERQPRRSGR